MPVRMRWGDLARPGQVVHTKVDSDAYPSRGVFTNPPPRESALGASRNPALLDLLDLSVELFPSPHRKSLLI